MSNPMSKIYWLFLPNHHVHHQNHHHHHSSINNDNIINDTALQVETSSTNWILFESKTAKHSSLNSDTILYRLPYETKQHEIYEKPVQPFYLTSILYVRVRIIY